MSRGLNVLLRACRSGVRFQSELSKSVSIYCTRLPFPPGKARITISSSFVHTTSGPRHCMGTTYSTGKTLQDLPAIFTLDMTLKSLLVDNLPSDGQAEAFNLIQDSAARGDNVGLDEFPSLKDLEELLVSSAAFSLRGVGSDGLLGLIIVQPSNYSRSLAPYLATIYVITAADISHKSHWRDLARLAERLVNRLGLRFGACLTSVFCACVDRVQALTEEGFQVTACINDSGTLAGFKNLASTYILYKDLRLTPQPKFPLSKIRDYIDSAVDNFRGNTSVASVNSFLPVNHVMHDGTEVVLRSMQSDESWLFLRKFGRGLGLDEWLTEKSFAKLVFAQGHAVLVQERRTETTVAGIILSTSGYSRGASARLMDNYFAINPDYVGRGLGKEMAGICQQLGARLGYTAIQTDTAVNNMAAIATIQSAGFILTGVIPKSIYILDQGWIDTVIFFKKLSSTPSILKLSNNS